jgi:NAD(P)-dependent dehydrogenase (short-subunit alcohol dehydrogenase family)
MGGHVVSENNVWFVTGAGRGLGVDIAQSALGAGHSVVATGRNAERVLAAIGDHENLLTVAPDITDPAAADAGARADATGARAAVERFGRIDVLVNNAGNFYAGHFEK